MEIKTIGDRVGLGITTVLAEVVLLQFSSQGMPKVSYMKATELFVVVSFTFIFLALFESALVYRASFWVPKSNEQDNAKVELTDKVHGFDIYLNFTLAKY